MEIEERIGLLYGNILDEIGMYDDFVSLKQMGHMEELYQIMQSVSDEIRDSIAQSLLHLIQEEKKYTAIWLYSSSMAISNNPKIMEEFLEYAIKCKGIYANTRFFLYYQFRSIIFRYTQFENLRTKYLKWRLLETAISEFRNGLHDVLAPVPKERRDDGFVLVISEQISAPQHGPTKIALDRCKVLMQRMGKKVLLVNTAEILSSVGEVPFFAVMDGIVDSSLVEKDRIGWKGVEIPYFQCDANMPNTADLRSLFQMVQDTRPGMAVAVGGSGVFANLLNDVIPVLMVGLAPSDLFETMAQCQTLSRPLLDSDKELLKKVGKDEGHVIESIFTSSLQPQTAMVTRAEMGLPEDKFVIVVVGYRLETDIDQKFAEMLKRVVCDDIYVALIGNFKPYGKFIADNPELEKYLKVLGITRDTLACFENCDLYVNPNRKGGGTSGVEAIYKGVPVVTCPYGDVAINVGEDFWVESYEEMPELILRYKNDQEFYHMMSEKAKKRAEVLLDSEKEFVRVVEEFASRCEKPSKLF